LRALRTNLRAAGYEVDTADTAAGALAAAALRPPEAMILDLVLPDGTGVDVRREFRTWSLAPVIVPSAVGEEREKVSSSATSSSTCRSAPSAGQRQDAGRPSDGFAQRHGRHGP
jgi:DNA-binding response OmpR family regulator